jgi:hypothetical protein
MAKRKILFDTVNVGGSEEPCLSQPPPAFGTFALKQMASAGASERDLARSGYLETFGHRFPGFNSFGTSHKSSFSLIEREG